MDHKYGSTLTTYSFHPRILKMKIEAEIPFLSHLSKRLESSRKVQAEITKKLNPGFVNEEQIEKTLKAEIS